MGDIAARVGLARNTLYNYGRGKSTLVRALTGRAGRPAAERVAAIAARSADPAAARIRVMRAGAGRIGRDPSAFAATAGAARDIVLASLARP